MGLEYSGGKGYDFGVKGCASSLGLVGFVISRLFYAGELRALQA